MDEDTELVLADLRLRLLFDEEHGELLHVETNGDHPPTVIQALGMLELAKDTFISGDYEDDDDE